MRLRFSYEMRVDFSQPVYRHSFSLRCIPGDTARQRILQAQLDIQPLASRQTCRDVWGSQVVYGSIPENHLFFEAKSWGIAETGGAVYEAFDHDTDIYRVQSHFTGAGSAIRKLHGALAKEAPPDPYQRVTFFMNGLHQRLRYQPNVTDVATPAEAALETGCGVCQDYAHIFLSLLRLDGIPARYVVGMMAGEGQSHAWVEVNLNGYWYGFDPTNNLLADDYYIKISHGRDYKDCIVSKGVFYGLAVQTQTVKVLVEKVE